jgi:hypothetical protein
MTTANRGAFLRWLRRVHGWVGLWGAALGLLFGVTGFLLNHRTVMKIPALQMQESQLQLALPQPAPDDAKAFAAWVQGRLELRKDPYKVSIDAPKPIAWNGAMVPQPAHWKTEFHLPQVSYSVDYLVGNSFATVKRQDVNALGFLMRLHKGVGMNASWILLVDTLAGAMIFLSLTGVLLWTKMRGSRLTLAGLGLGSIGLAVLATLQSL